MSRFVVKKTGFKPGRIREWLQAVRNAGRAKGWLQTGCLVAIAAWGALRDKPAGSRLFRARMRACMRCPLYNPKLRICLNYGLGCACYLPAKAAFLQSVCWRAEIKDENKWPPLNNT